MVGGRRKITPAQHLRKGLNNRNPSRDVNVFAPLRGQLPDPSGDFRTDWRRTPG